MRTCLSNEVPLEFTPNLDVDRLGLSGGAGRLTLHLSERRTRMAAALRLGDLSPIRGEARGCLCERCVGGERGQC